MTELRFKLRLPGIQRLYVADLSANQVMITWWPEKSQAKSSPPSCNIKVTKNGMVQAIPTTSLGKPAYLLLGHEISPIQIGLTQKEKGRKSLFSPIKIDPG